MEEKIRKQAHSVVGERKMLGIGMALMTPRKLLILDEPSFDLSSIIIDNIFGNLKKLKKWNRYIFRRTECREKT
jgi:ABC-type branched-subunit amino acid transport system ATPase component